ncbi:hypothetical protein [Brevundimonas sp. Root1279]|uniref:hypothetical protein n=1 Tax=Brevundimonas sp. Root1279 TaxID=1736443 RepID=UPI0006FC3ED2|nr:hypothetical protein [Brevundimonas sp. Root1279]KQW86539.1 hypothetical protein ASC65_01195 [Brevundimonas sp. Root1279]
MSAIRPPLQSPLFPSKAPVQLPTRDPAGSPVRASRSDFFKAALDGVKLEPEAAPAARAAPAFARASEERMQRPGSLLDIRV